MKIKQKYWLYLLIASLVIISIFIIKPYISPILLAGAIAYVLYPVHKRLKRRMREGFSAFLLALGLVSGMVLFIIYGTTFLISKLSGLYNAFNPSADIFSKLNSLGINNVLNRVVGKVSEYVFSTTSQIPYYAISTFIFVVSFYYFLIKGPEIYTFLRDILPLSIEKKKKLLSDIKRQVNAIVYIQLVVGLIQGIVGGLGLLIFGYEYVILGAITMAILGFIPVLGPPLFYIPIALASILEGNYFAGIGLLIYGLAVISTIDNFFRPFLVGKKAKVHPLIVIVGLFGGVIVFGVSGILIGPIILSITLTLIKDLEKFHV